MPWPGGFDRTGAFYDVARDPTAPGQSVLIRYDSTPSALDTLRPPHWEDPGAFVESISADGRSRRRSAIPFTPRSVWALTPEGDFWALHTGAYRLDRVSVAGDTVRTATLPFEPVPVTAAEKEGVIKAVERFNRRTGILEPSRIPDHRPPVTVRPPRWEAPDAALERVSPDGRSRSRGSIPFLPRSVWALTPDGDFWALHTGQYRLDRVSPGGDTVRTVRMPATVVWGPMGVHFVVRARIEKP